jgi:uncharacterized protein (DUF433 family)
MAVRTRKRRAFDPREIAAYSYAEAGRILGVPRTTISAWKKGQDYESKKRGHVVIEKSIGTDLPRGLSYFDLVEILVVRSLRTLPIPYPLDYIREAQSIAETQYSIKRLFLHRAFRHDGGSDFFLDQLGNLITLSPTHQFAMKATLASYLKRVEYATDDRVSAFYPVIADLGVEAPRHIVVTSTIAFGKPIIVRCGIRTAAVKWRYDAGESPRHIIADFGLKREEFEQAIRLEAA